MLFGHVLPGILRTWGLFRDARVQLDIAGGRPFGALPMLGRSGLAQGCRRPSSTCGDQELA